MVEFGGPGIEHGVSRGSPRSPTFGGLESCSWSGEGSYARAATLDMKFQGVAQGVEHVPQPELPHTLPPCCYVSFACRNHGLPRANRGFRLSVSCHPPPFPPYLKRVIIIRMPTRPPRLNRVTSLLAEAYCNPVKDHCNPNYRTPFPLVASPLLHVETSVCQERTRGFD